MNFEEYKTRVKKTCSTIYVKLPENLEHGIIGLVTEAGELLDALKKAKFYGKSLDGINVQEELGDIMWYLALAADSLDLTLEEIMDSNIRKLKKRYDDKEWSELCCANRDIEREMDAMMGGIHELAY